MIWRLLDHENVCPFLGICEDLFRPRHALVSPWMENGDVIRYLKTHPNTDRITAVCKKIHLVQVSKLNQSQLYGIASGLTYLRSLDPPVIHGDVKAVITTSIVEQMSFV